MNYYLVPKSIAESLQLTQIRKSSPGGMYLLSEWDLQPYGIERAISEGAIEFSDNRNRIPTAEPEHEQETNAEEETNTEEENGSGGAAEENTSQETGEGEGSGEQTEDAEEGSIGAGDVGNVGDLLGDGQPEGESAGNAQEAPAEEENVEQNEGGQEE